MKARYGTHLHFTRTPRQLDSARNAATTRQNAISGQAALPKLATHSPRPHAQPTDNTQQVQFLRADEVRRRNASLNRV
eukprot:1958086-Pleurochrysis_carterae.AAC.1